MKLGVYRYAIDAQASTHLYDRLRSQLYNHSFELRHKLWIQPARQLDQVEDSAHIILGGSVWS